LLTYSGMPLAPTSAATPGSTATTAAEVCAAPAAEASSATVASTASHRSAAISATCSCVAAFSADIATPSACISAAITSYVAGTAVSVSDATAVAIAATKAIAASVVAATEPGAGTDEDAAREPVRAVVSVGRAGVGRVVVVTVGAGRRAIPVPVGGYADADRDLCVGVCCGDKKDREYSEIFEEPHFVCLLTRADRLRSVGCVI
jgi:hypothetical protein